MNIIYLHQYYKTPNEGGSIRSFHIIRALKNDGNNVTVFSLHPLKNGKHIEDDIIFLFLQSSYSNKTKFINRIYIFIKYLFWVCFHIFKTRKKIDLIIATSTPITIGVPCLFAKYLFKIPFLFEVRDLWPTIPIQMKIIKNKVLIFFLEKLEFLIYKNALRIICLSEDIRDNINKLNSNLKEKLIVIPNFSDISFWNRPSKKNIQFPIQILYAGTLGLANGVDSLIEFMKYANEFYPNKFKFNIIGNGMFAYQISTFSLKHNNVLYKENLTKNELKKHFQRAHFTYVSYNSKYEILSTGSPNKFFDSLASGTPCIINFRGWIYEKLKNNHLILADLEENKEMIFNQIINIFADEYSEWSKKSVELAEKEFEINKLLKKYINEIKKIKENIA